MVAGRQVDRVFLRRFRQLRLARACAGQPRRTSRDTAAEAAQKAQAATKPLQTDFDGLLQRTLALSLPAANYLGIAAGQGGELYLQEAAQVVEGVEEELQDAPVTIRKFSLQQRKADKLLEDVKKFKLSYDGSKMLFARKDDWFITKSDAAPKPDEGRLATGSMKVRGAARGGGGGGGLLIQGLPIVKPPYGVISAIDLDQGTLKWQVPYGETPDNVRNHPALKGRDIGNTGMNGSVGVLITKTLVIVGDSQVTSVTHPRGAMLRAYDKATGKEVGAVWMPAPVSGSPMTYMWQGKQYIVVAIGGGSYSGEYLAFALPDSEDSTGQR